MAELTYREAVARGLALGAWGGISGLAVAIGPLVGGALTDGIGWEWIFFVNIPIGIAAIMYLLGLYFALTGLVTARLRDRNRAGQARKESGRCGRLAPRPGPGDGRDHGERARADRRP